MNRDNIDYIAAIAIALFECAAFAAHAPSPVTIILGLALFAAPGYLWSMVILGRKPTTLEGVVVACILAFIVPIFGGLGLYVWGIRLHVAVWIGLFTAATVIGSVALAIQRRAVEPPVERVTKAPVADRQAGMKPWRLPHAIAFCAAALIAATAVALAVFGAQAQKYPGYVQLWLTPQQNDNSQSAALGVTNEQGHTVQYRLVLLEKGRVRSAWNLTLTNGQTWQQTVPYTIAYSMVADLYKLPDVSKPYRTVNNGELDVKV